MEKRKGNTTGYGRPKKLSKDEIAHANTLMATAFEICGLVDGGNPVCPACGTSKKGRVKIRKSGAYTCHGCPKASSTGDNAAIDVVKACMGVGFVEACNLLLGKTTTTSTGKPVVVAKVLKAEPEFRATLDIEVMHFVRDFGSVEAAVKFYGRFHINPSSVVDAGPVVIENASSFQSTAVKTFGKERLISAGLIKPGADGAPDFFLLNARYPVVEPHRLPNGDWVGMQFRGSVEVEQQVAAYPAKKQDYDDRKAAWEERNPGKVADPTGAKKPRFVPKMLSLRGGQVGVHLIGMGLPAIAAAKPGSQVYVVEGLKDVMSISSLIPVIRGYGIPGTGVLPTETALEVLADKKVFVCTDGDEAGEKAAGLLLELFESTGIPARRRKMADGMDVNNILQRKASQKK